MDPDFWQGRWARNEIGWHQDDINVHLRGFWERLEVAPGAPVFVPLCGKSLDIRWIAEQGHPVIGVELSAVAVEDFFREQGWEPARTAQGPFTRWHSGAVTLLCGDFFDLRPQDLAGASAVYDRASLIALPPPMRQRYAAHLTGLLAPGTRCLLVTFEYPQQQMAGPPFSVTAEEVRHLYGDAFEVKELCEQDILQEQPRFREKGLTRLRERVFHLLRRG